MCGNSDFNKFYEIERRNGMIHFFSRCMFLIWLESVLEFPYIYCVCIFFRRFLLFAGVKRIIFDVCPKWTRKGTKLERVSIRLHDKQAQSIENWRKMRMLITGRGLSYLQVIVSLLNLFSFLFWQTLKSPCAYHAKLWRLHIFIRSICYSSNFNNFIVVIFVLYLPFFHLYRLWIGKINRNKNEDRKYEHCAEYQAVNSNKHA